ncbi:protein arginine N-methyltransferase 7 isoform X2 [Centruroides vittatus]|uniref:protein arginine N-methyltransferase 7 isoform X2 n=1 Tax=Centruroides vittatus TaxID=120091 RepID=UPI003510CA58
MVLVAASKKLLRTKLLQKKLSELSNVVGWTTMTRMSVFSSKFNPMTGSNEWLMQEENYDYIQEIARSSYADMLHDKERNQKYYSAIRIAIETMKKQGKSAKVLDIGTGTGLLSLMAVHCGADSVIACEAFYPVAKCARQVIKDNKAENKIKIIPKRSTELTVGPDNDLPEKANILVAEVFDTELIGEGALETFSHALKYLLEKDAIIVPSSAVVYGQVIQSDMVQKWNQLSPIVLDEQTTILPPCHIKSCTGAAAVHDLQLNQLSTEDFIPITEPMELFRFDFTGKTPLKLNEENKVTATALNSAECQALFMWWELKMDMNGKIVLNCAPYWAHSNPSNMQWRDHWMQAVYYLPSILDIRKNEKFILHSYHDEYSLWFDAYRLEKSESYTLISRPVCTCGAHIAFSRTRLAMLNDTSLNQLYTKAIKKVVKSDLNCLCVGDGSLLPLMTALLGAKKVYTVENQGLIDKVIRSYVDVNSVNNKVVVIKKNAIELTRDDVEGNEIDILMGEPYFISSILPWDNLHFWYVRSSLEPLLSSSAIVLPGKAMIKGVAVQFRDLHKIRAPVESVEGFNLSSFDKLIQEAINITDDPVEPHPLWEYPCTALSQSFEMMMFDLTIPIGNTICESIGCINLQSAGTCNGIAMWMEYKMDSDSTISNGPLEVKLGEEIKWSKTTRQGVHFLN